MKKHIMSAGLVGLLVLGALNAWTGAGSSGGIDNLAPDADAAWFYDADRMIQVCFETSQDFGVKPEFAIQEFNKAYDVWNNYLTTKKLINEYDTRKYQLATKIVTRAECAGSEDLKVYLGIENAEIEKHKVKYHRPTAFVVKQETDFENLWAKGFIWVTNHQSIEDERTRAKDFPNWTVENNLAAVFIHEIGHILGCGHINGTIMTEGLSDLLRLNPGEQKMAEKIDLKMSIDHSRELYQCSTCNWEYETVLNFQNYGSEPNVELIELTSEILGVDLKPTDTVILKYTKKGQDDSPILSFCMSECFGIQFTTTGTDIMENNLQIFKMLFGRLGGGGYGSQSNGAINGPYVSYGYVIGRGANPKRYTLAFARDVLSNIGFISPSNPSRPIPCNGCRSKNISDGYGGLGFSGGSNLSAMIDGRRVVIGSFLPTGLVIYGGSNFPRARVGFYSL